MTTPAPGAQDPVAGVFHFQTCTKGPHAMNFQDAITEAFYESLAKDGPVYYEDDPLVFTLPNMDGSFTITSLPERHNA